MALNGLGFANRRLYLTPHFFRNKPTEQLMGEGVTPEKLNDDTFFDASNLRDYKLKFPLLSPFSAPLPFNSILGGSFRHASSSAAPTIVGWPGVRLCEPKRRGVAVDDSRSKKRKSVVMQSRSLRSWGECNVKQEPHLSTIEKRYGAILNLNPLDKVPLKGGDLC
ncbi:DUF4277 domain-containing protein [Nitrosococcus wardiae]|uniref:DUF4277 domain-containing protein n=1 Tax=Nitrosococcus wardiae TaxID=1814290 RepID=A0A4P7C0F7_9GAMM|nr:DUF4277 domain-containing protein [Nitrosococcus wardiae]